MPVIAKPVSLAKVARRERGIEAVATDAEAKAEASAAAEADAKTRLQKVKAIGTPCKQSSTNSTPFLPFL